MKRSILISCIVILTILFAFKAKDPTIIYIIGDSTAANKQERTFPETGWGMAFAELLSGEVRVENKALNGRSSKSFKQDIGKNMDTVNHWQPIFDNLKPGDYVLIQFGHNDEKIDKPNVGTSLSEFEHNLVFYIDQAREKGAIPILLTPIARRKFENGKLVPTHGNYPKITKKVAKDKQVPCIDMENKTTKLLKYYGDKKSKHLFLYVEKGDKNYPNGKQDDTHLNTFGAMEVAKMVIEGIRDLKLPNLKKM
ncbi:MAG: GntR family transcriptional regulator [Sphingobacterium sp.]|jgi:lysophospholipase L1-like esterase|nr:GntR family transcriptional regulator [Sphingobacterium sp.]